MPFERQDPDTEEVKSYLFFPLRAIGDDYKVFDELMRKCLNNMTGARPRKKQQVSDVK